MSDMPERLVALNHALVAEHDRALRQRDEFLRTGVATAAPGQSHDTIFGFVLRNHLPAMIEAACADRIEALERQSTDLRAEYVALAQALHTIINMDAYGVSRAAEIARAALYAPVKGK